MRHLLPQQSPHHFTRQVSMKSLPSSASEHSYTWGLTPACPPVWCLSSDRSWITGRHRPKAGFSRAPFLGEAVPVSRELLTQLTHQPLGWLGALPQLLTHRQSITVTREQLAGRCHSLSGGPLLHQVCIYTLYIYIYSIIQIFL